MGLAFILTRVRWIILRRTGMDFMTWRGTSGSGVGTGMGLTIRGPRPIREASLRARSGCSGAAVGIPTRSAAVPRFAPTATRPARARSATSGSGLSAVRPLKAVGAEGASILAKQVNFFLSSI